MGKLGLPTEVSAAGENSGAFSSTQPFTPGERKVSMELLQETYASSCRRPPRAARCPTSWKSWPKAASTAGGRPRSLGFGRRAGHAQDAVAAAKRPPG